MPATLPKAATETLAGVRGKRIVLISHDLGQTGSPLLLVETAVKLREVGARVQLVTLGNDARHKNNCAIRNHLEILDVALSFARCAQADLTIANTAAAWPWVDDYLRAYPQAGRSLLWWIHEPATEAYVPHMDSLERGAAALFDSYASLESWKLTGTNFPSLAEVIYPGVADGFLQKAGNLCFPYPRNGIAGILMGRTRSLTRDEIRTALRIEANDFVLLSIGLASPLKGQSLLMSTIRRTLSENPNLPIKVVLVGFLSTRAKKKFEGELAAPVRQALRAFRTTQDLTPYYAAADALVMNSQGLGENFGRVTTEAMAFRLPVLGTDAGGTREIIRHGVTGLLHPVGADGQRQLAENIMMLLNDRRKAKAMGEAGYSRVQEKFTSSRFDALFGALLERILTQPPAHGDAP